MSSHRTTKLLCDQDLESIDSLASKFKKTVGFFTRETIQSYISGEGILGTKDRDGRLLGYVMFARYPDRIRIAQLCVENSERKKGIAKHLIQELVDTVTTEKVIKLKCRRDFAAHSFWAKIGFIAFDEVTGRSAEGHLLTAYSLILNSEDELALWKIQATETTRHCVIDAQIFFDFHEAETNKSIPSKSLLNDFFSDSLTLWITDELFSEISRCEDSYRRKSSLDRAKGFNRINFDPKLASCFEEALKKFLPSENLNQLSDIRQLSKAAASEAEVFLTRDSLLLTHRERIKSLLGIQITSPHEIILTLHQEEAPASYSPSFVAGLSLHWRLVSQALAATLPLEDFQLENETIGKFRESLHSFLAQPNRYRCEVLESERIPVALRVIQTDESPRFNLVLCRIAKNRDEALFASFVVADSLAHGSTKHAELIVLPHVASQNTVKLAANQQNFREHKHGLVRPLFTELLTRTEALLKLESLLGLEYSELTDSELESFASPLVVSAEIPTFLVSIKPGYARQMIDTEQAANELFGDKSPILLRTNNVYYKKKSAHRMLRPPGRILWYISGENARIVAISRLDEVEIGKPKALFKKYSKFGALEWKDLFELSHKELNREIMALRFSQTHSFRRSVSLNQLRTICTDEGFNLALPSPTKIPYKALSRIFALGF